jgi:hypothetical protein
MTTAKKNSRSENTLEALEMLICAQTEPLTLSEKATSMDCHARQQPCSNFSQSNTTTIRHVCKMKSQVIPDFAGERKFHLVSLYVPLVKRHPVKEWYRKEIAG